MSICTKLSVPLRLAPVVFFALAGGWSTTTLAAPPTGPIFDDVTTASGLDFVHWNARTGALYFPEMTGGGGALFDADGDGDLDIYLVQSAHFDTDAKPLEAPPEPTPRDRLYRNDGVRQGVPRFTDVTGASGLAATGYGMAVAVGDVDGDGAPDLFVANVGPNQLWRNRGDGTFENHTAAAGVAGLPEGWTVGASFADFDRDGDLDLFVIDYVRWSEEKEVRCFAPSSRLDYCGPSAYPATGNLVYRNRGDGTFEDWTRAAGVIAEGASLGVVAEDLDGDGWLDAYVANDGQANHLWSGQEGKRFEDTALLAGVALNRQGQPEASMGIAVGDADGDGDFDLFLTHLMGETNTLYRNEGLGLFDDATVEAGLAATSLPLTSFGTAFLDFDLDGRLDLVIASGAVRLIEERAEAGDTFALGQRNQAFWNGGYGAGNSFVDVSDRAGDAFTRTEVGRGLAVGDVDDDGDPDLLLINNFGPARLLLSRVGDGRSWLGLRAVLPARDGGRPRDALGARIEVVRRGAAPLVRRVATDGSYASASDPRVTVPADGATAVRVHWLDGSVETFPVPAAQQGAG
ncbi:MAG: CRTAC1 family protein, partial [Acidobacteriota bacterium]